MYLTRSVLILSVLVGSCAGQQKLGVSFEAKKHPTDDFKEISSLAVSKIKGLTLESSKYLSKQMEQCPQYVKTTLIRHHIPLGNAKRPNSIDKIDQIIRSYTEARNTEGVLIVNLTQNTANLIKKNTMLNSYHSTGSFNWTPGHGHWEMGSFGLSPQAELAPNFTLTKIKVGTHTWDYVTSLKYMLYNKILKKPAQQGSLKFKVRLTSYSSRSNKYSSFVRQLMTQSLLDQVAFNTCTSLATVQRTLYARGTSDKVDELLQHGLELVEEGRWDSAADKWKNALLEDPNNALTHHNLGVYYEYKGYTNLSAEHFKKVNKRKYRKLIKPRRYPQIISEQLPKDAVEIYQPRVFTVSNGRWVRIVGGNHKLFRTGQSYPVFKVKNIHTKNSVSGIEATETGSISIVGKQKNFILAEIKEQLAGSPIEMGHIILTQ